MNLPPQSRSNTGQQDEPDKPVEGYLSTVYESVSSTAQSAYNQLPSLDPLRALVPGHQTAETIESKPKQSENETKEVGQAIDESIQAPNQAEMIGKTTNEKTKEADEDKKPSNQRSSSTYRFIPHQAAAHSSSASSISRDSSTQGIITSRASPSIDPNTSKDPNFSSRGSSNPSSTPASGSTPESAHATTPTTEKIEPTRVEPVRTNHSTTTVSQPPVNGSHVETQAKNQFGRSEDSQSIGVTSDDKGDIIEGRLGASVPGDMEDNESDGDDDGDDDDDDKGDIEEEMGKKEKLKKRIGTLKCKVKAKLNK